MKMRSITLFQLTLSLLPLTRAWEVSWNDGSSTDHSVSGHGPSSCIEIDNPKGHLFKIDAQGEKNINMLLFTNSACSGDPAGMATDVFSKDASKDLHGFKVVSLDSTTGESSISTATTGPVAMSTGHHNATATATASMTMTRTGSSHPLSTSGSNDTESTSIQTSTMTSAASAATTTGAQASGGGSSISSSVASSSTTNAAVRVVGSNGHIVQGVLGGVVGMAAWII